MPYYTKDPKRDPNFDNHPFWGLGLRLQGRCGGASKSKTVTDRKRVSQNATACALLMAMPNLIILGSCLGLFMLLQSRLLKNLKPNAKYQKLACQALAGAGRIPNLGPAQ